MLDEKSAALIQRPVSSIQHRRNPLDYQGGGTRLRHKKDLVRVRILHFGSRRESFHVDIFAWRIRALHQVRFARNRNSVRIIAFCDLCRSTFVGAAVGGGDVAAVSIGGVPGGLNWSVRIERLLWRRVFSRLRGRIIRRPMAAGWWRWLFSA